MATTFVGRQSELAEVGHLLKRSRLVTLTGVGGVGKTRLARRALDNAHEIPVDVTMLVDLEPLDDPDALPRAVASSFGVATDPAQPATEALAAWFRGRDVLLILDTCDHLVDAVADLAATLLRAVPTLRTLITSRQPLGIPGEHVYIVPPMHADDAVALLRERLGHDEACPGEGRDEEEMAALCELLDGIPLAIELAALRLPGRSVRHLIGRLGERYELLTGGTGGPVRHETLRAAIGWSHGLCTPRERLLWARMSVFTGGFDLAAAEHVCAGGPLPAAAMLDTIGGLVEKSVLFRYDDRDGVRYRVLHCVREFGAEWLARLGELDEIRRRHQYYYEWLHGRDER